MMIAPLTVWAGELAPCTAEWEPIGFPGFSVVVSKNSVMPHFRGRPVTWRLIRTY